VPEALFPGVYVEELSFRAKVIGGVRTFVVGVMVGVAAEALRRRCRAASP
jgi:phage tail sheath protein FI